MTLTVSLLSHYRGKDTVIPFPSRALLASVKIWSPQASSSLNIKMLLIVRVYDHALASIIFLLLDCIIIKTELQVTTTVV